MSEARDILTRFQQGAQAEFDASGDWPKVCIMGHIDFEALQGVLEALIERRGGAWIQQFQASDTKTVLKAKANRTIMFQGVRIFASYSNETGMVFGGPERK